MSRNSVRQQQRSKRWMNLTLENYIEQIRYCEKKSEVSKLFRQATNDENVSNAEWMYLEGIASDKTKELKHKERK